MKKNFFVTILLVACVIANTFAQDHASVDAAVNKFQTLYNSNQTENIFNMLSDKIKTLMPLDKTTQVMGQLHQQVGELKSYSHLKQEEHINYYKATFEKAALTLVVSVDKENKLETFRFVPYKDETNAAEKSNFIYKSPDGDIYGSLVLPNDITKPVPVVLIIAGSGPTDRNCNQATMKCNAFKMLADSLQKAGIASVRYDKRGVGESAGAVKDAGKLVFEDMVNDATGIVKMLKADKRFSSVIVLGHSEGSLIGMLAAKRENADGYISVAGIAERADKIIVQQIATQSVELSIKASTSLDSLTKGYQVKNVDPDLANIFAPAVQPYIISWLKYEPQTEIKKLSIPVLIVQGTTDIQVGIAEAEKLKKAYPKATYKIVNGMNHPLKQAPENREQNMATYSNPTLPLSAGLMPAITGFVQKL